MAPLSPTKRAWLFAIALFLLNVYLCRELFFLEYGHFMSSIESTHITISRYALEHWPDLSWFPLWYGGIPYQNTYPPLMHLIVAAVAALLRFSPAHAHHAVAAFFYCLGPVSLYALALRLTKSRAYSFGAGVLYSLISPSAVLLASVRGDVAGPLNPRRLHTVVAYGEGPHIAAMALIPLAILLLDVAIEKRRPIHYPATAILMASVALTNWIGAFALAAAVIAYLLSRDRKEAIPAIATTMGVAVIAYLLACPGIPPSTIRLIQINSRTTAGDYTRTYQNFGRNLVIAVVAIAALKYILNRLRVPAALQFFLFFATFMGAVTLASEWLHTDIVPQAPRYHLEMDMAFCLAGVFVLRPVFSRAPRLPIVVAILIPLCYLPVSRIRRYTRELCRPVNIQSTIEYQEAKWFDGHARGERVMAPGTIGFWLNVFTDTPQLGGGFDQGVQDPENIYARYVIYTSDGAKDHAGEISLLWLRALGVHAVSFGGPNSREYYKPIRVPHQFDRILPEIWHEGDDEIYQIPDRTESLAHVLKKEELVARKPANGIDVEPMRPYIAALRDASYPLAKFDWLTQHSARIASEVHRGEVFSVQVTWHPGWRTSRGRIFADGLGQIALDPDCNGPCTVEIEYDGGLEMRIAKWLSALTLIVATCFSLSRVARRAIGVLS